MRDVATGEILTHPGGRACCVDVPARPGRTVLDAALVCPGECIFVGEERFLRRRNDDV